MRCFATFRPKGWHQYLSWVELLYNTSFHVSAQLTPICILYGREPPSLFTFKKGTTVVSSLDQQLVDRDRILEELKIHLHRAQQHMVASTNKHRRAVVGIFKNEVVSTQIPSPVSQRKIGPPLLWTLPDSGKDWKGYLQIGTAT